MHIIEGNNVMIFRVIPLLLDEQNFYITRMTFMHNKLLGNIYIHFKAYVCKIYQTNRYEMYFSNW